MKNGKKVLRLVVMTLVVWSLSACTKGKESQNNVDSSESIKIWSAKLQPATTLSSWKDSPFHIGLANATGVEAEWEFPTEGTDAGQAFNLMTTEDKLPNIILYGMSNKAEEYLDDGLILDLTNLLPEKAPNYWKFLQEHPDFDKDVKTDSGKYYSFGFFRPETEVACFIGPMVRQDWLDEQGLQQPNNIEELENVIRVFNKAYGAKLDFTLGSMSPGFAGSFNARGGFGTAGYVENGKVNLAQLDDEWKNYMTWLHKLYAEGLIDPDVVTLDDAGLKTKVANNKTGIAITTAGTLTTYMEEAAANNSNANWVGIKYPDQANGSKASFIFCDNLTTGYGLQVGGQTEGEQLDKTLEWLDWAFTEEGARYWNFGTEGKSYEVLNGEPEFTKEVTENELGTFEGLKMYEGNVDSGLGMQDKKVLTARMSPAAMDAMKIWYNENDEATAVKMPGRMSYTTEESKELATITDGLNNLISENSMKFLTGERSLEDFDEFRQEIKDAGVDRYLEIRQAAYDRYENR